MRRDEIDQLERGDQGGEEEERVQGVSINQQDRAYKDRRSRSRLSGSSEGRRSQNNGPKSKSGSRGGSNGLQPREQDRQGRGTREQQRRNRRDTRPFSRWARRSRSRSEQTREGPRRRRERPEPRRPRDRSRSIRDRRIHERKREEYGNRQETTGVVQRVRESASRSHSPNILKASSVDYSKRPPLTLKTHQIQVEHNVAIKKVCVQDMKKELAKAYQDEVPPSMMEILKKGEQIIDNRIKLIHIADVYGWEVANEYDENTIASNEIDIKKLVEAEDRVQKKKDNRVKELAHTNEKRGEGGASSTKRKRTGSEDKKERRGRSRDNR